MSQKKRFAFMIDLDLLERMRSMKARTGMSDSEQVRRAIRMWLDALEWPTRPPRKQHPSPR